MLGDESSEVEALARATGATIVRPAPGDAAPLDGPLPGYQRVNFAAADGRRRGAARAPARSRARRRRRRARRRFPAGCRSSAHDPLTIFDGAHNAPGIAALAASVPEGTVAVLSILDDKDAAGMLRALLPRLSAAVFTRAPNPRALPPATLADLASKVGGVRSEIEPDPRPAVELARTLAGPRRHRARDRVDLPGRRSAQRPGRAEGERAVNERGPSVIAMIALVAIVVALVILIFFAIGYAFGRAFL